MITTTTPLQRLLRGDLGLAKTFWIFHVLVGFIFNIGLTLTISARNMDATIAVSVMILLWTPIIAVALWRSATKYTGKCVWAYLVKIIVIISVIAFVPAVINVISLITN